jgi:hypothetical protein
MPPADIADLPLARFLRPEEQSLLDCARALPPESLHCMLERAPSLDGPGIRRHLLMDLLEPLLPTAYTALHASPPMRATLGAAPAAISCWPLTGLDLPAGVPATGPLEAIDLLDGLPIEAWEVRRQAGRPTCVAEASAACIELMAAQAARAFTAFSPRFLDDRLRDRRGSPLPGFGTIPPGTRLAKLGEAARILAEEGICRLSEWDDETPPPGTPPDASARAAAAARPSPTALYLEHPPGPQRSVGLARRIHAELAARRPVAIALPGFRDRRQPAGDTSWDLRSVWFNGHVPDKRETDVTVPESGHAVCLVGFQPAAAEPAGGYFLFRNSWGVDFGRNGNDPDRPPGPPRIPAPGFGTISARHVEAACWEAVSFAPEGGAR